MWCTLTHWHTDTLTSSELSLSFAVSHVWITDEVHRHENPKWGHRSLLETSLCCSSVRCGPGLSLEALGLMLAVPFPLYLSSSVLPSPD